MSNKSLGCLTAIALVIIAVIMVLVLNFSNDHTYTVTITDKERVTTQLAEDSIDSKYLILSLLRCKTDMKIIDKD